MSMDEMFETIVVGGGQAGLACGYYLSQQDKRFVILDDHKRTGEAWRKRWDSLRLFTPNKYNGLPGMPLSGPDFYFPAKDEIAHYLEAYVGRFHLPVHHNVKVESLTRGSDGFRLSTTAGALSAKRVIVATGAYQKPYTPPFARQLDPGIVQLHSNDYCNPGQLPVQNVLIVGAGNSGVEIGLELARAGKHVWLAGKDVGRIPADKLGKALGGVPYWFLISRVLSVHTPMGRKMKSKVIYHGAPLIRANRQEVAMAGIESTARVTGVANGKPEVGNGCQLPAEGIIWATGFRPDYTWIDLPVFDEYGYPRHERGVVSEAPGLYFVGLPFQSALSSALIGGVGADARYITYQRSR